MAQGGGAATRRMMMPLQQDLIDPDQPYPMNLPRLGHAVIVNNIAFEMPGSLRDVEALRAAYETIGFDVQVHNDCNAQEMGRINKWIMNDDNHTDSNCFALTIISHGNDKGHLFDKNRNKAWDTELFVADLSDVETLVGKPKIIVIQACRGLQWTEGKSAPGHTLVDNDDTETTHILPDKADMFLAYATVPRYRADAGTEDGSIYLQALAKYLQEEYMRRPLDKILKMVRQHMIKKVQETSGMMQCPEERNSLIYDVMFSEFQQKGVSTIQKQQKEIKEQRKMSDRIQKLEAKMEHIKKTIETQVVRLSSDTELFKSRDTARKEAEDEAWNFSSAGFYDEALIKAERALEIEEKELGARDEQMAELYSLLASIWGQKFSTGGYEEKEHLDILHEVMFLSEKGSTIYRQLPQNTANKRSLAWLLQDYVYALTEWSLSGGDDRLSAADARDKAKSTIEGVITIAQQINAMRLLADAYVRKGGIHQGEEEAVKWYSDALRITMEHFGENDELCGVIYYNTGIHHQKRGELEEAYDNYKQSYLIYKEIKGDKHPESEKMLRQLREDCFVKIAKQRGEKW